MKARLYHLFPLRIVIKITNKLLELERLLTLKIMIINQILVLYKSIE